MLDPLAEREVLRIVRRGLVSYTERTVVELEPLLEELARIRERDVLSELMDELGSELPELKRTLIDERDVYLAQKIREVLDA